jgi:hypothetical protein
VSNPINKNECKDDPSSAPESGEPGESGRNRGQIIEPGHTCKDRKVKDDSDGIGEEFESGRQDAAPRSGA